jgi:hypothetical protein
MAGVVVAEGLKATPPDIRVLYTSGYGKDDPPVPFEADRCQAVVEAVHA